MHSKFQDYLIEEIESFGEISLQELIPKFLEKNHKRQIKFPLSEYPGNYKVDAALFSTLLGELKEIMKEEKLCLYLYNHKTGEDWEDTFDLIPKSKVEAILNNKNFFVYEKGSPVIYLSTA